MICPTCGRAMRKPTDPGNGLRRHRVSLGQSLDDVHAGTGITKAMLSRMETNKCQPSMKMARRLADYYGVSLEHIEAMLREVPLEVVAPKVEPPEMSIPYWMGTPYWMKSGRHG